MAPRVLCIVLCYNGVADTLACLGSLAQVRYPALDLLVVDNASQDSTVADVRRGFPGVQLIETGANLGFAAGNNVGLRYALDHGYDYALLLNNDTEVDPDFLARLVAAAEENPAIGVAGPTIYYHERRDLIWSAGGYVDWRRGIVAMRTNEAERGQYTAVNSVEVVTGCALLVSRAAMERAGLLDERFFMYFEETEWCVRIARHGFSVAHVPHAHVWHKIPLNARFDREYLAYYMTRNRLLFLAATRASLRAWLDALILQDLRTFASLVLRPKWRTRSGRSGMLYGWIDFWGGRFGKLSRQLREVARA